MLTFFLIIILIIGYIVGFILTWGIYMGDILGRSDGYFGARSYSGVIGFISLMWPLTLLVSPFVTNFFEHGFKLWSDK